mmetsp:Transcript_86247/g.231000  ORF Transcript_86247/g.231000 Transcript_86247/m.231000 type:complete len:372 (+) Transcript_86247:708-1823(+)
MLWRNLLDANCRCRVPEPAGAVGWFTFFVVRCCAGVTFVGPWRQLIDDGHSDRALHLGGHQRHLLSGCQAHMRIGRQERGAGAHVLQRDGQVSAGMSRGRRGQRSACREEQAAVFVVLHLKLNPSFIHVGHDTNLRIGAQPWQTHVPSADHFPLPGADVPSLGDEHAVHGLNAPWAGKGVVQEEPHPIRLAHLPTIKSKSVGDNALVTHGALAYCGEPSIFAMLEEYVTVRRHKTRYVRGPSRAILPIVVCKRRTRLHRRWRVKLRRRGSHRHRHEAHSVEHHRSCHHHILLRNETGLRPIPNLSSIVKARRSGVHLHHLVRFGGHEVHGLGCHRATHITLDHCRTGARVLRHRGHHLRAGACRRRWHGES